MNDTDVDIRLFCEDSKLKRESFACGVIQKGARNLTIDYQLDYQLQKSYCLNISNCLQPLSFICEVNCTKQDLCKGLFEGIYINFIYWFHLF